MLVFTKVHLLVVEPKKFKAKLPAMELPLVIVRILIFAPNPVNKLV